MILLFVWQENDLVYTNVALNSKKIALKQQHENNPLPPPPPPTHTLTYTLKFGILRVQ